MRFNTGDITPSLARSAVLLGEVKGQLSHCHGVVRVLGIDSHALLEKGHRYSLFQSQVKPGVLKRFSNTGGLDDKKLINKKCRVWIQNFLAWKSRPSSPGRQFLRRIGFCSLERGRLARLRRARRFLGLYREGAAPPNPPVFVVFC